MSTGDEMLHPIDQVTYAYSAAEPKTLVLLPHDPLGAYAEQEQDGAMAAVPSFPEHEMPVRGKLGGTVPRARFAH